ncbi:MAG: RagB/SusD family nutrient uptake outer membrane protein [Prevotella sp.]|nr:RagB/SusD family nutrient uptake outer membrane protein [Prevotella sp.]
MQRLKNLKRLGCVALLLFSLSSPLVFLTSCVDTVILPDNKTVDEDFWQKKTEVDAVVAAAYAQLRDATAIRNMIVWGDFRSDELMVTSSLPASAAYKTALAQIYSLNIDTENSFTSWYPFYSAINYCNLVLQKAEGVIAVDPDYTQGDYDANKAQMLALRAFCYFYLTRVFHDIPVTPKAYLNSSDDFDAPQANPDSVLTMCINDLKEASKYAISGSTFGDWRDKGYLNQDGINAILADIYLWRASINRDAADYEACVEYCDKVIKAKKEAYELNPRNHRPGVDDVEKDYYLSDYEDMYNDIFGQTRQDGQRGQNAEESIFELQFNSSDVSNPSLEQMYFRYGNSTSNDFGYLKASSLFGRAAKGGNVVIDGTGVWNNSADQRLFEFLYDANSDNVEQFGVRKFVATVSAGTNNTADNKVDTRSNVYQNWIFYRLTDVMLMKAEALVQLYELGGRAEDDPRNEQAFLICKYVNDRSLSDANKNNYALKYSLYKDYMELLVLAERARELCFEGKRWFDLMRYNYRHTAAKADLTKKLTEGYVANFDGFLDLALRKYAVPSAMKAKMRDERYLYMPINQDEVELNPNLRQNPVYKSSAKY